MQGAIEMTVFPVCQIYSLRPLPGLQLESCGIRFGSERNVVINLAVTITRHS